MSEQTKHNYKHHTYFLLFDFILRWLILAALQFEYIGVIWFWIIQILAIPLFIIFFAIVTQSLENATVRTTTGDVIISWLILAIGVYVVYTFFENLHTISRLMISFLTLCFYGFYLWIVFFLSTKKTSKEKDLNQTLKKRELTLIKAKIKQSLKSEEIEFLESEDIKYNKFSEIIRDSLVDKETIQTIKPEKIRNIFIDMFGEGMEYYKVSSIPSEEIEEVHGIENHSHSESLFKQKLEESSKNKSTNSISKEKSNEYVQNQQLEDIEEKAEEKAEAESGDIVFTNSKLKNQSNDHMHIKINTDLNDTDIVKLEGMLHYTNDRVNSFILESALFSGLAFAGFITLMASDKVQISEISNLLNSISELLNSLIFFDYSSFFNRLSMFSQEDLFIIILIESLFCTLSFISVIASRLRFSDILEEIEISVKMARSLNNKEEEVALRYLDENRDNFFQRISYLNQKIEKEIDVANQKFDSIAPILNSIRIVRSFGMIFFFSMIFTSALLISSVLAMVFLLASILVTIIMNVDHSFRIKKLKNLNRHLPTRANFESE